MSISEERFLDIRQQLSKVTDNDWKEIFYKCESHINQRLKYYQIHGAHSEKELGMSVFDFYFGEAFEKIQEGIWEWKYEQYTLLQQFIRIIDSMISEVVRKYKNKEKKPFDIKYLDIESTFHSLTDGEQPLPLDPPDDDYESLISSISEAISGNTELEDCFFYIMEQKKPQEIAEELNWDIKKVYKRTEQIKTKTKEYMNKKREVYNG